MAIYKLGDIFDIGNGSTPSTVNPSLWKSEINWYTPIDLKNSVHTIRKITKGVTPTIPKNTVLMSSRAPIGYIGITNNVSWHSQGVKSFINDERIILNKYFYFWLNKNIKLFISRGSGSTFLEISSRVIQTILITPPLLSEQQKIIDIIEPFELIFNLINNLIIRINDIVKLLPRDIQLNLHEIAKLSRNPKQNTKQISAKCMSKRQPLLSKLEDNATYATNIFNAKRGTILINSIRMYLEKFSIAPYDVDATGTLFHITTDHFTTILSELLNDNFWLNANLLSHGTKMPVLSKNNLLNMKLKKRPEISRLKDLYINLQLLSLKINSIKSKIIKLLII